MSRLQSPQVGLVATEVRPAREGMYGRGIRMYHGYTNMIGGKIEGAGGGGDVQENGALEEE